MTEGVFEKKRFLNIACLIFGVLLVCIFVFVFIVDSEATLQDFLVGVSLGGIIMLADILSLLYNHNAFLRVEDNRIVGRCGWFKKFAMDISEIEFVSAVDNGQIKLLSFLLKNNRRLLITGMSNPFELCSAISRRLPFDASVDSLELINELSEKKRQRKKLTAIVCCGCLWMFAVIFITVLLTGGKDIPDFSELDWVIFAGMGFVQLISVIALFYFACKCGKMKLALEFQQYRIRRTCIETAPLLPGNARSVFADDRYIGRITVFGYPNSEAVYYSVEEFDSDFTLKSVYTSEVLEDITVLDSALGTMIELTHKILQ